MKIAILGNGQEGQSASLYLAQTYPDAAIQTFSDFNQTTLAALDLPSFDLVVRSPSVPPRWLTAAGLKTWTSATQLFFAECPCPIIGVTGTKGKGTTSSLIAALLTKLGRTVHLVGNIGTPALSQLDKIQKDDMVVFELSSFQLWDLQKSPHIAVVLGIEPDHLNVHADYADYVAAKGNIARFQNARDFCFYNPSSPDAAAIARLSHGTVAPYLAAARATSPADASPAKANQNNADPADANQNNASPANAFATVPALDTLLSELAIPGRHNADNATAALCAVAASCQLSLAEFVAAYAEPIRETFRTFAGLPHRLQFLRELDGVKYYDDNFSTNLASTAVALAAFPGQSLVLIAGGRDKTANRDLPALAALITDAPAAQPHARVVKAILIGESGHELAKLLPADRFELAESLADAITRARRVAEAAAKTNAESESESESKANPVANTETTANPAPVIVLMSPAAASFDMFKNVYDRGAQYQALIANL